MQTQELCALSPLCSRHTQVLEGMDSQCYSLFLSLLSLPTDIFSQHS